MLQNDNYNWQGVLQFLHVYIDIAKKQYEGQAINENTWFLQKKALNQQIKQLQARVSTLQNINSDLLNRNRMLQYCLRQLKGDKPTVTLQQEQAIGPKIPQRRSKPNKNHINKILQSLGIRNLLENIQKDIELRGDSNTLKIQQKPQPNKQKEKSSLSAIKSSSYRELGPLCSANGHQDGVRDLAFLHGKDILVSVSEDSTMKLWNVKTQSEHACLGTIRGHTGAIFALTQGQNYVFSGGIQGIIRVWDFNSTNQKKDISRKSCVGNWNNSGDDKLQQPEHIWQLLYSPQYKTIFSTSPEISIKSYTIQKQQSTVKGIYKKSYSYQISKKPIKGDDQIPTSICIHNGYLVAGYVSSYSIAYFDVQTGKIAQDLKLALPGQVSTNKIVSHTNVLMGAFEDKMVRLFDKSKMTYSFKAHQQSVTSIATTVNINQFFTCGNDGYVKLWDLRKLQPIFSFNSHVKKFDESVHCIATSQNYKAASGGADAVIKMYSAS